MELLTKLYNAIEPYCNDKDSIYHVSLENDTMDIEFMHIITKEEPTMEEVMEYLQFHKEVLHMRIRNATEDKYYFNVSINANYNEINFLIKGRKKKEC